MCLSTLRQRSRPAKVGVGTGVGAALGVKVVMSAESNSFTAPNHNKIFTRMDYLWRAWHHYRPLWEQMHVHKHVHLRVFMIFDVSAQNHPIVGREAVRLPFPPTG